MKRQLLMTTALMLFAMMGVRAQSFEFQYRGQSVADGDMVTIAAAEDEYGFGELWCESNPGASPTDGIVLKLLSGSTASGSATLTIEHNSINPATLKWCMGGTCNLLQNVNLMTKDFSTDNGIVLVQFDAENLRSTGYLLATLTATVSGETHSVKIQFTNGESAGVKGVRFQKGASSSFYDLCGRRVQKPAKGLYITSGKKKIIK